MFYFCLKAKSLDSEKGFSVNQMLSSLIRLVLPRFENVQTYKYITHVGQKDNVSFRQTHAICFFQGYSAQNTNMYQPFDIVLKLLFVLNYFLVMDTK